MEKQEIKKSIIKSWNNFKMAIPIMFGILLLVSLMTILWSEQIPNFFTGGIFDPLWGALAGSISFGIALTSYIVGGELLTKGVSLLAVTAFIMTWTTVGVVMLPLEAKFLGWRFAIYRNIMNFFFAIIIAFLTIETLKLF